MLQQTKGLYNTSPYNAKIKSNSQLESKGEGEATSLCLKVLTNLICGRVKDHTACLSERRGWLGRSRVKKILDGNILSRTTPARF